MYSDDEDDYSGSSDESVVDQRYSRWPTTYENRPTDESMVVEVTSAEEGLSDQRENRDSRSQGEDEEYDDDLATHWRAQLLSIIKKRLPKECSSFKLAKMLEEAIMTECEDEHGEVDVKKYREVAENVRKRLSYTRTDVVPTLLAKAYKSEDPFIILNHFKSESKNQIKKKRKSGELPKATDAVAASSGHKMTKDKILPIVGSKQTDGVKRKTPSPSGSQADEDDDDVPLSTIRAVRLKPEKKRKLSTGSDSRARTFPVVDSPPARSGAGRAPNASTPAVLTPAGSRAATTTTADGSTSSSSTSSVSPLHAGVRLVTGAAAPGGGPSLTTPPQASVALGGQRSAVAEALHAGQDVGGAMHATAVGAGRVPEAHKAMHKRREEERLKREANQHRILKAKAEEQKRMREREEAERRRREEGKRRAEEERKKAIERAREDARQRRSAMCRVVTFDDANAVLDQIRRSGINIYSTTLVK